MQAANRIRGARLRLCVTGVGRLPLAVLALCAAPASLAQAADGFTEPYRTVEVAAAESGIITVMPVSEGDSVHKGDVLAMLDRDVLLTLQAIAEKSMNSKGVIESALAELRLRSSRLEKLEVLRSKGHARQEEVERARTDVAIAEAQVLSAREDLAIRRLEYEKIKAQIERRVIRAPMDGVIARIQKEEGAYVAPNDPFILTLVQLNPLLATFSLASVEAAQLSVNQKVVLHSLGADEFDVSTSVLMQGVVEFIAPVTDAESGTVRVKVRIDNPDGRYRSGERCALDVFDENQQASR